METKRQGFAFRIFRENETADLQAFLSQQVSINPLDIEDVLTNTQLSKFENRADYMYVALQLPDLRETQDVFVNKEIHFFVSEKALVVYDKNNFSLMTKFIQGHLNGLERTANTFETFYEMVDYFVTRLARAMPKFSREVEELEMELFDNRGTDKDFIIDIQILKRNLINFLSLIIPLVDVLQDLQNFYIKKDAFEVRVELLDDSLDKVRKMKVNLQTFRKQMSVISETNEALIARNTNEVIKVMTATSIIVIIPSFIAAFFGMNIWLGWDPEVPNYWPLILIILSIVVTVFMVLLYFRKRRWL